ncbi:glycosyl transferase family 1 [Pasteurellaceae bacterium RH1A]|nr:glycosyl transferase family 1 [Pasteurellaceae bacterium RH1A]
MKKICFFGGNLNHSGGTERVSTSIANALAEKGYPVIMLNLSQGLSPFFALHPSIENYQLHAQPVSATKSYFSTVSQLRSFLIQHKIDTLIVVESMLSLFSLPAVFGLKIKHITWEHFNYNVDLGKRLRRLARHTSRLFSDTIVTLTEKDKTIWLDKTYGRAELIAIPNPSPYAVSANQPSLAYKTVLAVGRLTHQKGFDLLLQAWAEAKKHTISEGWQLQIVGEGEDKAKLEELITSLNLVNSVTIYPFSNKIEQYYQQASVFCLSSLFEGLPMVLLEAQSFGLPVVAFDCITGPSEIIEQSKNGFLCKPEQIGNLVQGLVKMMSLPEDEYYQMSVCAKEQVKTKFNLESIIEKWINIL